MWCAEITPHQRWGRETFAWWSWWSRNVDWGLFKQTWLRCERNPSLDDEYDVKSYEWFVCFWMCRSAEKVPRPPQNPWSAAAEKLRFDLSFRGIRLHLTRAAATQHPKAVIIRIFGRVKERLALVAGLQFSGFCHLTFWPLQWLKYLI